MQYLGIPTSVFTTNAPAAPRDPTKLIRCVACCVASTGTPHGDIPLALKKNLIPDLISHGTVLALNLNLN